MGALPAGGHQPGAALRAREEHRAAGGATEGAFWDLVIIDEAHHLKGEKAFEAAQALAGNSWGLLLLTATPMQLDPAEYHGLLTLIDAATAPTVKGFEERLARQEELSAAVRALLEGKAPARPVKALAEALPGRRDASRRSKDARRAARAPGGDVQPVGPAGAQPARGGGRLLHAQAAPPPGEALRRGAAGARRGAGRAARSGRCAARRWRNLLRRLESQPRGLRRAVRGNPALARQRS